jgi:hypothetical protein
MISYNYLLKFGSKNDEFISTTNNHIYVLRGEIRKDESGEDYFNHRGEILIYKKLDFPKTNKYFNYEGKQKKEIVFGGKRISVDTFVKQVEKLHTVDELVTFRLSADFISYIRNTVEERDITHVRFHSRNVQEKYFNEYRTKKRVFLTCFDYRSFLTDYVSVKEKNLTIYEERLPQTQVHQDFSFTLKSLYFKRMKEVTHEVHFLVNDRVLFINDDYMVLMMNQNIVEPVINMKIEKDSDLMVSALLSPRPDIDTLFV